MKDLGAIVLVLTILAALLGVLVSCYWMIWTADTNTPFRLLLTSGLTVIAGLFIAAGTDA